MINRLIIILIAIAFVGCDSKKNNSVSDILINHLESNNQDFDSKKLNDFLIKQEFPYIIISDSIFDDDKLKWSIHTVSSEEENVFRDLLNFSICIEKENEFVYFGTQYSVEKYDSILTYYFKYDCEKNEELILQISTNNNELSSEGWKEIIQYIRGFHKKSHASFRVMDVYSVIGFDLECIYGIPTPPIEEDSLYKYID